MEKIVKFLLIIILILGVWVFPETAVAQQPCCNTEAPDAVPTCALYVTRSGCETEAPAGAGCEWNPLCDPASALEELVELVKIFLYWTPFLGILAGVIFLLIGSFNYVTAGDNVENAEKARLTITYAIVGIILSTSLYLLARILVAVIPGLGEYVT